MFTNPKNSSTTGLILLAIILLVIVISRNLQQEFFLSFVDYSLPEGIKSGRSHSGNWLDIKNRNCKANSSNQKFDPRPHLDDTPNQQFTTVETDPVLGSSSLIIKDKPERSNNKPSRKRRGLSNNTIDGRPNNNNNNYDEPNRENEIGNNTQRPGLTRRSDPMDQDDETNEDSDRDLMDAERDSDATSQGEDNDDENVNGSSSNNNINVRPNRPNRSNQPPIYSFFRPSEPAPFSRQTEPDGPRVNTQPNLTPLLNIPDNTSRTQPPVYLTSAPIIPDTVGNEDEIRKTLLDNMRLLQKLQTQPGQPRKTQQPQITQINIYDYPNMRVSPSSATATNRLIGSQANSIATNASPASGQTTQVQATAPQATTLPIVSTVEQQQQQLPSAQINTGT